MILLVSNNPPKVQLQINNKKISIKKIAALIASLNNTVYYNEALDSVDILDEDVKVKIYQEITNILLHEPIRIKKSRD